MKYNRISTKFWTDEKVLQWDNETRLLALYLLTCSHKTTEGLFRLPKQYICADLEWSMEGLAKPFAKLLEDGFIKYDEGVNVILINNALKYQSPDNPNQEKAAISLLKELPETELLYEFIRQAKRFSERFYKRLVEQFGKPLSLSLTPTLSLTLSNNKKRLDSKNEQSDRSGKSDSTNTKKSNGQAQDESQTEINSEQIRLSNPNQQQKENAISQKQNDTPEKVNSSGETNSPDISAKNITVDESESKASENKPDKDTNTSQSGKEIQVDQDNPKSKNTQKVKTNKKAANNSSSIVEFDCNSKPYKACCFLIDRIIDNNPRARVPNKDPTNSLMQKWCQELDRLHRLGPVGAKESDDKDYSWQEICQIIHWSQQHQFWKANILSAGTLRKQVTKLENQMRKSTGNTSKRMDLLKEIYLDAQEDDAKGGFDVL